MAQRLSLTLLPDAFAICRLDADAQLPAWAVAAPWWSMTRTPDELSVVCAEACVPDGVVARVKSARPRAGSPGSRWRIP